MPVCHKYECYYLKRMCMYIPVHLKLYENIEIFPWAFIWLASWKITISRELMLHLFSLTNTSERQSERAQMLSCDLHLTFSINGGHKLLIELTIYIKKYIDEGNMLTDSSFSNNPGEANEEHDTPDIQHASYLWVGGASKGTWEMVEQNPGLCNPGVQALLTLRLQKQ